jgi:hypothetical protein
MDADARDGGRHGAAGDAYRVAVDGNLVALVWTRQPSLEGVRALERALRAVTESTSARVGFVTLIEPDAIRSSPESSVRQATAAVLKAFNTRIGAAVVIYEARGLKATILRSVIMIINALAGSAFPNQVTADAVAGARWLVAALGRDAPPGAEARVAALLTGDRASPSHGG